MTLKPQHYIGGRYSDANSGTFQARQADSGETLTPLFPEATEAVIDAACQAAAAAFAPYRGLALEDRALFLETLAAELAADEDAFAARAPRETGLPEARIRGELGRTVGQLRLFASVVRAGDFLGVRIDTADPERQPQPRPDIRQYRMPLGPVAVFGASNFPLAFSVAGGDTASALAAGSPVVVKAHPAHPGTSALAVAAIDRAIARCGVPPGTFSLVYGRGNRVGEALVTHPAIKAVGFTGSNRGGQALARLAAARPEPIPVYAEMGSVNPLFLLPQTLASRGEAIAEGLVNAFTLGCGQFCTNPGIVFAPRGPALEAFVGQLAQRVEAVAPGIMLHGGILDAYQAGADRLAGSEGVTLVARGREAPGRAGARLYRTSAERVSQQPELLDEVFGPCSLLIEVDDDAAFAALAAALPGQLTAGLFGTEEELAAYPDLLAALETRAGRVLFNGFPTGVEVNQAMVHGGPFPATSDGRSTSVGTLAIERFLRPVCYQDCPDALLPAALQNANPLGLRRLVDSNWEREAIRH